MLTGIQIILARAVLSISQEDLAKKLDGVSLSTLRRFEGNRYKVYGKGRIENMETIEKFFTNKGIRFAKEDKEVGLFINTEKNN